jgi:hypothetical protein
MQLYVKCVDHAKMLQEFLVPMIFLKFAVCDRGSILRDDVSTCKHPVSRPPSANCRSRGWGVC